MKKLIITGNVGHDPEIRADQQGNQFVTFSVAISVGTKLKPKTDWVDVSCSGKLSDLVKTYVSKGDKVLAEGFPAVDAYINNENEAVGKLRVYANTIEFLSRKEQSDI